MSDSKNARRKARRYSTPVCPSAIGERAAWRELAEGSGRMANIPAETGPGTGPGNGGRGEDRRERDDRTQPIHV